MVGALVAIGAALAFGLGSVLQKIGAPPAESRGIRRLVIHLLTNRTYLAGTALDLLGFVLTAVAARHLPLFALEGILSTSVGVTAVLALWLLGERLTRGARRALSLMVVGLVLLSFSADRSSSGTLGSPLAALATAAIVMLFVVAIVERGAPSRVSSSLLAALAGVAFGAWAAVPRLTEDGVGANVVGASFVVVGLIAYGAALRRGSAVGVMAITVAAESVLPALCGLALGDRSRSGAEAAALAGYVLAVASAIVIALLDGQTADQIRDAVRRRPPPTLAR